MIWVLPLVPVAGSVLLWVAGRRAAGRERAHRVVLGVGGVTVLVATLIAAMALAASGATSSVDWGAGLSLHARLDDLAATVAILVPAVAAAIVAYAAAHEPPAGLTRLVSLLVAFVGAMELLVVADDFLTLLIGWELVGAASWALIAHDWRRADVPPAAAHAFNTTRFGDLGLFLAAGAALAGTGSLRFADLAGLGGGLLHVLVAGVVVAAAAKSAQVPFSPWLFSAMAGPTPVSALLHAATMVAAGAYLLARLHPHLAAAEWFGPAAIGVGIVTALAGGVVASLQDHAKKLLAGSTSAHYGLMFVAVGAGYPAVAVAHLVVHAAFKAALFLSAGVAISAAGTEDLGDMRLGKALPVVALLTWPATLALAGVPPLAGAWTKEKIVAAAGHEAVWLAALVGVAGALSAFYAFRLTLLAYGRGPGDRVRTSAGAGAAVAVGALAVATVGLSVVWLPGGEAILAGVLGDVPSGKAWEAIVSIGLVLGAAGLAWGLERGGRLAALGTRPATIAAADWLGIPAVARRVVVDPVLAACGALARFEARVGAIRAPRPVPAALAGFDRRIVDAGVRGTAAVAGWLARTFSAVTELRGFDGAVEGLARLVGAGGRDARRAQTGLAHQYYVILTVGLAALVVVAVLWR